MKITDEQINIIADTFAEAAKFGGETNKAIHFVNFLEFAQSIIALAQEVPDLEWVEHDTHAVSKGGAYSITNINNGAIPTVYTYDNGSIGIADSYEAGKVLANEHNRKRVLSQLRYGGE